MYRPKTDRIYLNIGAGYCLELSLKEAESFIDQKTAILKEEIDKLNENAADVKAHIKLFLNLMNPNDLGVTNWSRIVVGLQASGIIWNGWLFVGGVETHVIIVDLF